jgi:hypothetical protein
MREFGRRAWYKRSAIASAVLAENAVYRYKTIIGRGMKSRTQKGQRVEVELGCRILDTITVLGMPHGYRLG